MHNKVNCSGATLSFVYSSKNNYKLRVFKKERESGVNKVAGLSERLLTSSLYSAQSAYYCEQ